MEELSSSVPTHSGTWTTLVPLKLLDAATPMVESLDSYISRLAAVHGQSIKGMLTYLDDESGGKRVWSDVQRSAINGPGNVALRRAMTLERKTGQSLRAGTFSALTDLLSPRSGGIPRRERAWCPRCLETDDPLRSPNDRLIWNFAYYSHCSIHGVQIERRCTECCAVQRYASPLEKKFSCVHCGASLSGDGRRSPRSHVHACVDGMLEELVQWTSSDNPAPLDPAGYRQYLTYLKDNSGIHVLRANHPNFFAEIYALRSQQPSVRTLLNLASLQGVTVLDILLRPKESASKPLFERSSDFEGIPFPTTALSVSSKRIDQIVSALLEDPRALIPPLRLICSLENIQPFKYSQNYESSGLAYRRRYEGQKEVRAVGARMFTREFQAALHDVQLCDGQVSEDFAARRMKARGFLRDDLVERMVASAGKIVRARSSILTD